MDDNLKWAIATAIHDEMDREDVEGLDLTEEIDEGFVDGPELVWLTEEDQPWNLFYEEDDFSEYLIRDLAGIETHPELSALIIPTSRVSSLQPLTGLPELKRLVVGLEEGVDLKPLAECGELVRCALRGPISPEGQGVLAELRNRGDHVDLLDEEPDWEALSAPFSDRILKLAVLNHLAEYKLAHTWPEVHTFDEFSFDKYNMARIMAHELTQTQIEVLDDLYWAGGGMAVQHIVYPQWDGESEEFDIGSLEGLGALTNLKTVKLDHIPDDGAEICESLGIELEKY